MFYNEVYNDTHIKCGYGGPSTTFGRIAELVWIGGLAALVVWGVAAAIRPDAYVENYKDVDSCESARGHGRSEVCAPAFLQAKAREELLAPRYLNQGDCEANYGKGKCKKDYNKLVATQVVHRGRGSTLVAAPTYYPEMSGFAYSRLVRVGQRFDWLEDSLPSDVKVQPLFKNLAGVTHFGNGLVVDYASRPLLSDVESASRAVYPSGQKVESYPN